MTKMTMKDWEGSEEDEKADTYEGKMHKEGSPHDVVEDRAAVKAINKGKSGYAAHKAKHEEFLRHEEVTKHGKHGMRPRMTNVYKDMD